MRILMMRLLMFVCGLVLFFLASPFDCRAETESKGYLLERYSAQDMYNLGEGFRLGQGKYKKDLLEAKDWHMRAAARGHARSMWVIGNMHLYGEGAQKNKEEAINWYEKAVQAGGDGRALAAETLGEIYLNSKNCGRALDMYRIAADEGIVSAQSRLGLIYFNGQCTERNFKESARWFLPVAKKGDIIAAIYLAHFFHEGMGVEKSNVEAIYWAENATKFGWPAYLTFSDNYLLPVFATPLTETEKAEAEQKLGRKLRPLKEGRPVPLYE